MIEAKTSYKETQEKRYNIPVIVLSIALGLVLICAFWDVQIYEQKIQNLESEKFSLQAKNKYLEMQIVALKAKAQAKELIDSAKESAIDTLAGALNTDWKVKTNLNTSIGKVRLDLKNKKKDIEK